MFESFDLISALHKFTKLVILLGPYLEPKGRIRIIEPPPRCRMFRDLEILDHCRFYKDTDDDRFPEIIRGVKVNLQGKDLKGVRVRIKRGYRNKQNLKRVRSV